MNKKLFLILIALMSLSLLGIIFVQGYWIRNAYKTQDEQFTINVRTALLETAKTLQKAEVDYYYSSYSDVVEKNDPEKVSLNEIIYKIIDERGNTTLVYSDTVLEEDFKLSSGYFDTGNDTFIFKKVTNTTLTEEITEGIDGGEPIKEVKESFRRWRDYERDQFEKVFEKISSQTPIHIRVSEEDIEAIAAKELRNRGIDPNFEYAIYSGDIATKVRSNNFTLNPDTTYSVPLFVNEKLESKYQLYFNLVNQDKVVLNSILGMAIMSLIFTGIIILTFYYAIKQIFEQRQISEIKSDFINNMTHEFKTPIATINLALDAMKNPKVKDNQEFLTRYMRMIRDENRRMHAQVENVLRISKLEKNQLDLPKERYKLHDIIEDAITHVELLVEDRDGYVKLHFGALKSSVLANESHLTNVIVNVLDNAIKYSEEAPKVDIFTENVKNSIVVKIRDQGLGMSKNVQKRIFEKFYREHTGNIHNVKGHGLGLAYVKRILDDHDAEIYVESEQGKGSTFIIKLHLIS